MFSTQQTFSGSFNFAPSAGEVTMNAFGRIGIRPTEILASHIQQATMEMNLLFARFNNSVPNLWAVDLQTVPLTQGVATYSVPAETVQIMDMYVRVSNPGTDRMMFGISRTEYASQADKTVQGPPNQFWFDRTISPENSDPHNWRCAFRPKVKCPTGSPHIKPGSPEKNLGSINRQRTKTIRPCRRSYCD